VRTVALFIGLGLFSVAIVAMLESGLGLPPWDVLHQGIALHTPLSLGTTTIVVGVVILLLAWLLGQPPGFGTVANTIVIGVGVDVLSGVAAVQRLADATLAVRIGLMLAGIALFGIGSALYIGAGMGAGPRDSLMLAISARTGRRIGLVRGAIEVSVLLAGVALGGTAGIGTLALAILVGPAVEASFWGVRRLGLAEPVPAPQEWGPLDVA
jgi:uncharacterized membrane protein YczE